MGETELRVKLFSLKHTFESALLTFFADYDDKSSTLTYPLKDDAVMVTE